MTNIFNEILNMSLEASYLIVAVTVVRFLLKKSPKYFRKILWIFVGVRLAIPFSLESVFSLVPKDGVTASITSFEETAGTAVQTVQTTDIYEIVSVIWITVAAGLLIYGAGSFIRLRFKIRDAVLLKDNIYQSEKVNSPFVCGFVKPKIYIPYGIEEETLEYVLQHEIAHISQGDHILKAVSFLLLCVHWFNPFVWISYFLFCKDVELLCDELVVKRFDESQRKKYALALLEIGVSRVKVSACPVAFGEVGIKERVKNAVNYKKAKRVFLILCVFCCVAVAVCFMTEPASAVEPETEEASRKTVEVTVNEKTTEPSTEQIIQEESTTEPVTEATYESHSQYITQENKKTAVETSKKSIDEATRETTVAVYEAIINGEYSNKDSSTFLTPYEGEIEGVPENSDEGAEDSDEGYYVYYGPYGQTGGYSGSSAVGNGGTGSNNMLPSIPNLFGEDVVTKASYPQVGVEGWSNNHWVGSNR